MTTVPDTIMRKAIGGKCGCKNCLPAGVIKISDLEPKKKRKK